jgi:hypothetical protein
LLLLLPAADGRVSTELAADAVVCTEPWTEPAADGVVCTEPWTEPAADGVVCTEPWTEPAADGVVWTEPLQLLLPGMLSAVEVLWAAAAAGCAWAVCSLRQSSACQRTFRLGVRVLDLRH